MTNNLYRFLTYHYIILYHPNLDFTLIHLISFPPQPGQGQSKRKGKSQSQGSCPSHRNHFLLEGFCLGPRSLGIFCWFLFLYFFVEIYWWNVLLHLQQLISWSCSIHELWFSAGGSAACRGRRSRGDFWHLFFWLWMNFTPNDLSKTKTYFTVRQIPKKCQYCLPKIAKFTQIDIRYYHLI